MNKLLKLELVKVEELIYQLEQKQSSLSKTDFNINSMIQFIQVLKNKIKIDDNINIFKLKEIISKQEEKVKEVIKK